MTQYQSINTKLSNSQLEKLKSVTKNVTKVTSKLSQNVMINANNETMQIIFPIFFYLIKTFEVFKAFANGSSVDIKLSKTKTYKII